MRGALRRMEADHEGRAWLAYHTAVIPMMRRPPRSPTELLPKRRREQQTPEAMMAAAMSWHNAIQKVNNGISGRHPSR